MPLTVKRMSNLKVASLHSKSFGNSASHHASKNRRMLVKTCNKLVSGHLPQTKAITIDQHFLALSSIEKKQKIKAITRKRHTTLGSAKTIIQWRPKVFLTTSFKLSPIIIKMTSQAPTKLSRKDVAKKQFCKKNIFSLLYIFCEKSIFSST